MLNVDDLFDVLEKPSQGNDDFILVKSLIITPETIIFNILGGNIIFKKSQPGFNFVHELALKVNTEEVKTITRAEYSHIRKLQNIFQYLVSWSDDRLQNINNSLYFRGKLLNKEEESILVNFVASSSDPDVNLWLTFMNQAIDYKNRCKRDLCVLLSEVGLTLNKDGLITGCASLPKDSGFVVGDSYTIPSRAISVQAIFSSNSSTSNEYYKQAIVGFSPLEINSGTTLGYVPSRTLSVNRCKILEYL